MKKKIINPIIKDTITFIQTSDETNGAVSEMEVMLMPGGSNISHYHKMFTEKFTAIQGVLGLKLAGGHRKLLHPGDSYIVTPYQPHSFFNPGDREIIFNVKITPGHKGFENSLRILYGLAEDGHTDKKSVPKSLRHVAVIANLSDSYLSGGMKLLSPVIHFLAKRAQKNGKQQALINRYCK